MKRVLAREHFIPGSLNVLQSYSFLSREVSGDGFYIAGDAAGFVDPIYSNGVTVAFYSGYLAAWAIDRSLRKKESAHIYQSIYARQVQGHLRLLRNLALPDWIPKESPEVLRKLLWAQNETERDLMSAVAVVSGRADNVYRIYDRGMLDKALAGRVDEIKLF
jgi:flavin-dependent dehydrogenase